MFHKSTLILVAFIILFQNSHGQEKQMAKANKLFNEFSYVDAREIYLQLDNSGYKSAELYKKLGDSYYFNAELEKAAPWYKKLLTKYKGDLGAEDLFRYAQCLKSLKNYAEADKVMARFNQYSGDDSRGKYFATTRDYLDFIEKQSGRFTVRSLPINSSSSDYAPSFRNSDQMVFASSRVRKNGLVKVTSKWDDNAFLDLFASTISDSTDNISKPIRLKGKVNSKFHESSTTFSTDGKTMYFTRNNYSKKRIKYNKQGNTLLKLFKATYVNGKWKNIEELPFNSDEYSTAHPALSADGTKLYFASDMPGGKGLSDLYVVDIYPDGTYGEPRNLGNRINTEGRETFPFISDSGNLYFSSDGHVGLGGLDIFVSVPDEENEKYNLSKPFNVGKPINSSKDDFSFVVRDISKKGYFSSNRTKGKGNDDIYGFTQVEELITECNQYLAGIITDSETQEKLVNADVILMDQNGQELQRAKTTETGSYKLDLNCETHYVVRVLKKSYFPFEEIIKTHDVPEFTYNIGLKVQRSEKEEEFKPGDDLAIILELKPIYFSFDRYEIRADDEPELQKVILAMKENPTIKIDVRSHTDSNGDDAYNLLLSQKRAESTVEYMVVKGGIDPSRLSGTGYGETQLLNECANNVPCTIEQHRPNRRSEFIVVK